MRLFMPMVFIVAFGTLVMAVGTVWLGYVFHQFEDVAEAGTLECQPVHGITGAYDVEPVPGRNMAFLSTYDKRGAALRGELLRFDFDNPLDDASWRDRTGGKPLVFEPGGISLHQVRLPSGVLEQRLFVVNRKGPEILIFDVGEGGDLTLAERFTDERLTSPNDVVATGPKSFYVTNDTAAPRQSLRAKLEFLLGLPTGTVMHFDGSRWAVVAEGLRYPNGIALTENGGRLFVAEMRAPAVHSFRRDVATNTLDERGQFSLRSFPNNLSLDTDGGLLIGAVPQPFAYQAFTSNLRESAPSQVLRLHRGQVEVLYQDPGGAFSAATVASRVGESTVIGSAADDKFMICPSAVTNRSGIS